MIGNWIPMITRVFFIVMIAMPINGIAQYRGGQNDGIAQASANLQNASPNIFVGGGNDGHSLALASGENSIPSIFLGGSNDGEATSVVTSQNGFPSIYTGGSNDGAATLQVVAQNDLPQIYTGGSNDGVAALVATNENPLPAIYSGGVNDGISTLQASIQNPLPNIYAGGVNDGYAISVSSGQNSSNPLPITLIEFTGSWFNDDAVLAWRTADERMIDHFELERSDNGGSSFHSIATVLPNSDFSSHDYRYTEVQAYYLPAEFLLYRLRSTDQQGESQYSAIVRLSKDKTQPVIVAYPNPTSGRFTLAMMNVYDFKDYSYFLTGTDGRLIRRGNISEATTSFDLGGFPAATYQLVLFKDGKPLQHFTILLTP